jgi:hypothetical protein
MLPSKNYNRLKSSSLLGTSANLTLLEKGGRGGIFYERTLKTNIRSCSVVDYSESGMNHHWGKWESPPGASRESA